MSQSEFNFTLPVNETPQSTIRTNCGRASYVILRVFRSFSGRFLRLICGSGTLRILLALLRISPKPNNILCALEFNNSSEQLPCPTDVWCLTGIASVRTCIRRNSGGSAHQPFNHCKLTLACAGFPSLHETGIATPPANGIKGNQGLALHLLAQAGAMVTTQSLRLILFLRCMARRHPNRKCGRAPAE
jgi:hypothetical protein